MTPLEMLKELEAYGGERQTLGLTTPVLERFLKSDPKLTLAIEQAYEAHKGLRPEFGAQLQGSEKELCAVLQQGLVNFYPTDSISPYVPLGACGPWLVTSHGAVVHDSGGYGMLGLGHAPQAALDAMAKPWVMANVMTPSFSQRRLVDRLRAEIGSTRGHCPFQHFVCLNSGSESVTMAARISDINARTLTEPGGVHHGKTIKFLGLKGAFHGRTDRPAQVSDSTLPKYRQNLASFRDRDSLITVDVNDVAGLRAAYEKADAEGVFVEAMFIEPVMGEGNPGRAITREFYAAARELTTEHGGLLLCDSIQAGLRAHGTLSIVDYPGFQDCIPPDMETYSKALNAGQYPLSVLALSGRAAGLYVRGVYGNTMTTNPRALEVACAVLDALTPELRQNICDRGVEFLERFEGLRGEFGDVITGVQGTGLLLALGIDPKIPVEGAGGVEECCRRNGVGVIHGGKNALRFTPHFAITSAEIDAIMEVITQALRSFVSAAKA